MFLFKSLVSDGAIKDRIQTRIMVPENKYILVCHSECEVHFFWFDKAQEKCRFLVIDVFQPCHCFSSNESKSFIFKIEQKGYLTRITYFSDVQLFVIPFHIAG